ncbi:PepSY domain-containing protein [Psychromonas ossibalaenae]|uniref:PepSY domain-containing protein n=1 Tax=Psychromonas ossibalaenae TaxID=444922 RepID=UPI00037EF3C5|nr:PepSY domain-containing protein [Psychromonas ossibalaenae]
MKLNKLNKLICAAGALTSFTAAADNDALSQLALKRASFTMEQAVEKVSCDYPGQIAEFAVDDHRGQSAYQIKVLNLLKEEKYKLYLSTEDGSLLKEKSSSFKTLGFNSLDDDDYQALQELQVSEFNLQSTIAMVSEKYNAEIVEFELENEKGITFYKFKLLDQHSRQHVYVDVKTGEMNNIIKS